MPEPDTARAAEVQNGISNLLSDVQIKHRGTGYESYDRYIYKIVDRPGLERGAAIETVFDPSRNRLTFNRIIVRRDGKVIDHLDRAKIDVYRRETDSQRGIFDGRLTALINLDDIRVGDTIEYARTFEVMPIVDANSISVRFYTQWYEPVGLIRYRLIWPKDRPVTIKTVAADVRPGVTANGDDKVYLWEMARPQPSRGEENVPAEATSSGYVELSSVPDWQSVVDQLKPYYQPAVQFPPDFAERLNELAKSYSTPTDRLVQALRLVQDNIRYVSLAIGTGSYLPRSPAAVIESGFGDCKDKTLLLVSILQHLGIDAVPALTDIDEGYGLPSRLPSVRAFDHIIVKATIDGRTYWVDPTNYLQGGKADTLVVPDFGYALPIVDRDAKLEALALEAILLPTTSVEEHFALPRTKDEPMTLSVVSTYRGRDAEYMRYRLKNEAIGDISRRYRDYYSEGYPGIRSTAELSTLDDRDANLVTVTENYELPASDANGSELLKNFPLRADVNLGQLPTPSAVDRRTPVAIGRTIFREQTTIVSNLKSNFVTPDDASQRNRFFWFDVTSTSTMTEFKVDWRFMTVADRVPVSDLASYKRAVDNALRNTQYQYDFTYEQKAAGPEGG